jgi:hypothetical protein
MRIRRRGQAPSDGRCAGVLSCKFFQLRKNIPMKVLRHERLIPPHASRQGTDRRDASAEERQRHDKEERQGQSRQRRRRSRDPSRTVVSSGLNKSTTMQPSPNLKGVQSPRFPEAGRRDAKFPNRIIFGLALPREARGSPARSELLLIPIGCQSHLGNEPLRNSQNSGIMH